jgi:hypothetical protein
MSKLLGRSDVGARARVITSLSLALLAYEHLATGFIDYHLLSLCFAILCIIYLLAFLSAFDLRGSSRGGIK